ncbi:MAG: bifunctional pyr operon transcriptional regulator/uracil phosphoribosyltransferase PyrR [Deltaproteobacteria bacterium]|nr:bifunctional pyr operon transcriptional regulator/uracil phosphoribosyltransferase PyrR [Candidatus Anaeroferrophillacea bacterium]
MTPDQTILDARGLEVVLGRMAHEVIEHHPVLDNLVLVGVRSRGVHLAERLQCRLAELSGVTLPLGILDITMYRDDLGLGAGNPVLERTEIPFSLEEKTVILVDDVIHTGRTVRAALDGLMDFGRPRAIQLLVLVDRGGRELPIRPDYVGTHVHSSPRDKVKVRVGERDGFDAVMVEYGTRGQEANL